MQPSSSPPTQPLAPFPYMQKMSGKKYEESIYHVYSERRKYVRVNAFTASEAIIKSGIANPLKVQRFEPLGQVLLAGSDFQFSGKKADAGDADAANAGGGVVSAVGEAEAPTS